MKKLGLWLGGGVIALLGLVAMADNVSTNNAAAPQTFTAAQVSSQTIAPIPAPNVATTTASTSTLSNNNYYVNSNGESVHGPAYSNSAPAGATAQCRDGTYSFSEHRSGTCSRHGGVGTWL